MTQHYEMLWDCPKCSSKGLLGITHRHCPHCGTTQDENLRYFPRDGEEISIENHRYFGRDWDCSFCSTPNSNSASFCSNCGASKEGAPPVRLSTESEPSKKQIYESATTDKKLFNKKQFPITPLLIGAAGILFIGFISLFFIKSDEVARVTSQQWLRTVSIEQFRSVSDSEWCSSMPFDAYRISRHREISHYNQIADGQNCTTYNVDRGDGSFSKQQSCSTTYRKEPVYADRCHYTIDRWKHDTDLKTSGSFPQPPYWHKWEVVPSHRIGAKRIGRKSEVYRVSLKGKDDSWTCFYQPEKWKQYQVGMRVSVQVRMLGGADCDSVKLLK